jgi:hypothetical protein
MLMRALSAVGLLSAVPVAVLAQQPAAVPVPPDASGSTAWRARLDDPSASIQGVRFEPAADGAHVTTRIAAIFWRPADSASGAFAARATFAQLRAPSHPEGYGLLVGGRDLGGADQDYLYFLVRGDGRFLVKHRAGGETHDLLGGWKASEAVRAADADGKAANALEIRADADSVRFLVNGTRVAGLARAHELRTDGIVGLRINHHLDVRVADFAIERR